jgi:biotin transport system substrate-specific component
MLISVYFFKKGDNMHSLSIDLFTKKEIVNNRTAVAAIGVVAFALLTWIGAYIYIPLGFTPVPITLQTFFVFLSGAILGKKLGPLSQASYLIMGTVGLPIFTAGGFGVLYLLGPTGGYILGFIAASYIIGLMLKGKSSVSAIITAFAFGAFTIYACGTGWLVFGLGIGIKQALFLGVLPFMSGCLLKIIIATIITKSYLNRSREIFD